MAVVAVCALLFAAHRSLRVALRGGPEQHLPDVATGMLLILAAGLILLTSLRRRYSWRGLAESRDFLLVMLLTVGLLAGVFSLLASPTAGVLYLTATLAILAHAMRR